MGVRVQEDGVGVRDPRARFVLVEASLLEELGLLPPGPPDVPARKQRPRRGRRIRFAIWTALLVVLVCLAGAIASPAKTPKKHAGPVASTAVSRVASGSAGPAPVAMPRLLGRRLVDATAKLAATGLDPRVRVSFRSSRKPAGRILFQRPAPGASLADGQPVRIIVARPAGAR